MKTTIQIITITSIVLFIGYAANFHPVVFLALAILWACLIVIEKPYLRMVISNDELITEINLLRDELTLKNMAIKDNCRLQNNLEARQEEITQLLKDNEALRKSVFLLENVNHELRFNQDHKKALIESYRAEMEEFKS